MEFSNFWLINISQDTSKRAILRQPVPERKEKNVLNSKVYIKSVLSAEKPMNQYQQEHLPVENRAEMSTTEEKTERKEA